MDAAGWKHSGEHSVESWAERCSEAAGGASMRNARASAALARFLLLFIAAHRKPTTEESSVAAGRGCWRPSPRRHDCSLSTWSLFIARANPLQHARYRWAQHTSAQNGCMSAALAATEPRRIRHAAQHGNPMCAGYCGAATCRGRHFTRRHQTLLLAYQCLSPILPALKPPALVGWQHAHRFRLCSSNL